MQDTQDRKVVNLDAHRPEPKCKPSAFNVAPYKYGRFEVELPAGESFDTILKPDYWSQVAHMLQPPRGTRDKTWEGSIIEVRTEDHQFFAELYVRAVKEKDLKVAVLKEPVYFFEHTKSKKTDRHKTRFNVGAKAWDVVRNDAEVVAKGFKLKEDAEDWIRETEG